MSQPLDSAGDPTPAAPRALEPEITQRLEALYAALDAEVATHEPVCAISGRCCRFKEYGHTLFLSGVEAAYLLERAPAPVRPLDDGATCPWQDLAGRCTAREARPSGCRVYFCDPRYQPHAGPLTEAFLSRLKRLCDETGRPWAYAPLHWHLRQAWAEGRLDGAPGPSTGQEVLDTSPSD